MTAYFFYFLFRLHRYMCIKYVRIEILFEIGGGNSFFGYDRSTPAER